MMLSFPPISPEILSVCFHCFSLAGVAVSFCSTGISFLVKFDGSLIHFAFSLGPSTSFEKDNPSSKYDDCFWCPIKVLIPTHVRIPLISNWFIRFSGAKVPWLQASRMAKVMIPLLDSLR